MGDIFAGGVWHWDVARDGHRIGDGASRDTGDALHSLYNAKDTGRRRRACQPAPRKLEHKYSTKINKLNSACRTESSLHGPYSFVASQSNSNPKGDEHQVAICPGVKPQEGSDFEEAHEAGREESKRRKMEGSSATSSTTSGLLPIGYISRSSSDIDMSLRRNSPSPCGARTSGKHHREDVQGFTVPRLVSCAPKGGVPQLSGGLYR